LAGSPLRSKADLGWAGCAAVERDPLRVSGAWVLRDCRIPVAALFENLKDGVSLAEFVELFLGATPAQPRSKHGWFWSTSSEARLQLRIRQVTDRIQATIALIETGGYQELANP
jgi:hypothetical protein